MRDFLVILVNFVCRILIYWRRRFIEFKSLCTTALICNLKPNQSSRQIFCCHYYPPQHSLLFLLSSSFLLSSLSLSSFTLDWACSFKRNYFRNYKKEISGWASSFEKNILLSSLTFIAVLVIHVVLVLVVLDGVFLALLTIVIIALRIA